MNATCRMPFFINTAMVLLNEIEPFLVEDFMLQYCIYKFVHSLYNISTPREFRVQNVRRPVCLEHYV